MNPISGLTPGWTYYLSRDGSSQLQSLPADSSGVVALTLDISVDHHLVLMAQHGSVSLTAASCSAVGTWDATNRVCTLTQDILSPPIYVEDSNLTLDCAGHLIGGPVHQSIGVSIDRQQGVAVRNCVISSVDFGITAGLTQQISLTNITATNSAGTGTGSTGVVLRDISYVDVSNLSVTGFDNGISAWTVSNLTFRGGSVSAWSRALLLYKTALVAVEDLEVDGSLSGVGPADPLATVSMAALELNGAVNTSFKRLVTSGPMTAFASVLSVGANDVIVQGASIEFGRVGITFGLSGTGSSVAESTFRNNQVALALGANSIARVYHNNFIGNSVPTVAAAAAVELSDTDASSPTYRQGNFWGRSCPGPLFEVGIDSNYTTAVDSHPFGQLDGWDHAVPPGCATLAPPILIYPANGSVVATRTPLFRGTVASGATVELFELGNLVGADSTTSTGAFEISLGGPLPEGPHEMQVRARASSSFSALSVPVAFRVDLLDDSAPGPPVFTFPANNALLTGATVAVAGTAEPGAKLFVTEGARTAVTSADNLGAFLLAVPLLTGTYTLSAVAEDAAGNRSAPSVPVTFTVSLATQSAPLIDPTGTLRVTSIRDSYDPFVPSLGEVNTLTIEGEMLRGPGANGNHVYQINVRREVARGATGVVVVTTHASLPITMPLGTNGQRFGFGISSDWNGGLPGGGIAPAGPYISNAKIWIIRDPVPPGTPAPPGPVGPCGPVSQPVFGACTIFELPLLTLTHGLLDAPPPVQHRCGGNWIWWSRGEECNGIDDNCNGSIDEGGACEARCSP